MSVVQFKCQMQSKAFVKMVLPLHCNIYWSQTAVHYSTHCTMYVQCTHCTGSLVTTNQLSQQSSRQAPGRAASQFLRFREGEVLKNIKKEEHGGQLDIMGDTSTDTGTDTEGGAEASVMDTDLR